MFKKYPILSGLLVFVFLVSVSVLVSRPIVLQNKHAQEKRCVIAGLNQKLDFLATLRNGEVVNSQAAAAAWTLRNRQRDGIDPVCGKGSFWDVSTNMVEELLARATPGSRIELITQAVEREYTRRGNSPGEWARACIVYKTSVPIAESELRRANSFQPTNVRFPKDGIELCRIGNMTLYHEGKDTPTWHQRMRHDAHGVIGKLKWW